MANFVFLFLIFLSLFTAIGVIASKEAVHSALFLTLHLLSIGGLFLSLGHQFLAVAQMLIYAGAVMVVFMFAVTTLSPEEEPLNLMGSGGMPLLGIGAGIAFLLTLSVTIKRSAYSSKAMLASDQLVETSSFAADLFGPFLLPFEGTAFLLLTALVGAMILGGRRQIGDG